MVVKCGPTPSLIIRLDRSFLPPTDWVLPRTQRPPLAERTFANPRGHMSGTEPNTRRLSVVMPAYDEEATNAEMIARVLASPCTAELVVVETFELQEDRFGIEPEMTAKVARGKWRIDEVGISYSGRTYAEGKKIGWRDGVRAIHCIVLYSTIGERFPVRRLGPLVRRITRSRA